MGDYAAGECDEAAFRNALSQCVMAHGVMPSIGTRSYVTEPADRPRAHSLARLQAKSPGWTVSGARHVALELDEPGRILLSLMDGNRTLGELAVVLRNGLADAGYDRTPETVQAMTLRLVWLFARLGLLTEAPGASGLQ